MNLLEKLKGKKTIIGSLSLCLLGLIGNLDLIVNGQLTWMSPTQYAFIGTTIAGLTGAAMRLGISGKE